MSLRVVRLKSEELLATMFEVIFMNRTGFARPGSLQILVAVVISLLFGIGPLFMALTSPTHAWAYVATGPQAILLSSVGLIVTVLYAVGCIRYCKSKGYSGWLGFWLFLAHIPGFIAILLLPDVFMRSATQSPREDTARAAV